MNLKNLIYTSETYERSESPAKQVVLSDLEGVLEGK
jgi:hypothetical protein